MSIPISNFRLLFSQFDFHEYLRNLHGNCYLQVFYIKTIPDTIDEALKTLDFFFHLQIVTVVKSPISTLKPRTLTV